MRRCLLDSYLLDSCLRCRLLHSRLVRSRSVWLARALILVKTLRVACACPPVPEQEELESTSVYPCYIRY